MNVDTIANGTDWMDSRRTSRAEDLTSSSPYHDLGAFSLESIPEITLLEQELIEGYVEYQSLLDSVNREVTANNVEFEQPELLSALSETESIVISDITVPDSITQPTEQSAPAPFVLTDVWKARLLLLLSAALYGTNFTMVKSLNDSMSVGISSTLRFGFAAVVMLPWLFAPIDDELKALAKEKRDNNKLLLAEGGEEVGHGVAEEPTRLSAGLAGMEIGMYASVGYIAQAVGLKTTTASKSAFICSMAVVIVPILDYIWGKELLRRQVIGACLAAFGVWALELGGQQNAITEGDMFSLIQPLMFGLGFWRMEAAVEKYPTEAGRLAAAQLLMVFLISFSYLIADNALLSDAHNALPTTSEIMAWLQDPHTLGMLLWTGVVTTAFTIWMETLALKTLTAAETTLIFSTEPLFGAAFASVVANECLGMEDAVGAAFIIGGCIVSGMDFGSKPAETTTIDN